MTNKTAQQKIPRGYKKTRLGLIPKDWQTKHLSEIASVTSSNVDKKTKKQETPVRLCNYTDVYANEYIYKNMPFMKASATKNEIMKFSLRKGDVIITKDSEDRMDIAVPAHVTENMDGVLCGYHLAILRPKEELLEGLYLSKILQLNEINHHFVRRANGVTRFGLTVSTIENSRIYLPPLREQKHISKILTTWDDAIAKTQKLISAKRKFKKALMQQLLTGKHRFNEFIKSKDVVETHFGPVPKDWPYVKIGEIANQISERNDNEDKMTVLSCTKYDGLVDSLKYFGKKVFSDDTSNYKVVKYHQFAYATNHIEEGSIGLLTHRKTGLVSPMYTVFETTDKVYSPFLYSLFKTELYRHIFQVNTSASINRRGSLRWNQFSIIRVALPDIDEQKKISAVLAHCDKEIEQLNQQHELLKQQKRGLMQKLLTGKIRVKV